MFKVNNRNTRARCEICLKLAIKTPEQKIDTGWDEVAISAYDNGIKTFDRVISYPSGVGPRIICKEELIRHSKIKTEHNDYLWWSYKKIVWSGST